MKKLVLSALTALLPIAAMAQLSVTIDVDGLSYPRTNLNALQISGVTSAFRGNKSIDLEDGEYQVRAGSGGGLVAEYGKFTIENNELTSATGVLTITNPNTVGFDTTLMTKITMDSRDLEIRLDGGATYGTMFTMAGVINTLQKEFTIFLPNAERVGVGTRAGVPYGYFGTSNGSIVNLEGALKLDSENPNHIRFDRDKLAPINLNEGKLTVPEHLFMSAVRELTGYYTYRSIYFFPAGTHQVITRWGGGVFGTITVDENGGISTDGSPTITGTNVTDDGLAYTVIEHDVTKLNAIDLFYYDLSSSESYWPGELYQTAGAARNNDFTRYYLPKGRPDGAPVVFQISHYGGYSHLNFGEIVSDSNGVTVRGALIKEGDAVYFDTCSMKKVTFMPESGEMYGLSRWAYGYHYDPISFFVPVGASFPVKVAKNGIDPDNIFKATIVDTGYVVEEGVNDGRMTILVEDGHCTPPDEDLDGVFDEVDACPGTVEGETVNVDGCSPSQEVALVNSDEFKNHGQYVRYVAHLLNDMVKDGLITEEEKDEMMSSTAQKK